MQGFSLLLCCCNSSPRFVSRYDLLFPHLFFSFFLLVMLSLLLGGFALDMKRKKSGMFLEDSEDSNGDRGELSQSHVAPRYSHFSELSEERSKDNSRESRGGKEEIRPRSSFWGGF